MVCDLVLVVFVIDGFWFLGYFFFSLGFEVVGFLSLVVREGFFFLFCFRKVYKEMGSGVGGVRVER